jgi:hypothetical protein
MRHEMLTRLRTWLRPKREVTPEDVEALEYSEQQREWKRTQRALHNAPPGFGTKPLDPDKGDRHDLGGR